MFAISFPSGKTLQRVRTQLEGGLRRAQWTDLLRELTSEMEPVLRDIQGPSLLPPNNAICLAVSSFNIFFWGGVTDLEQACSQ